MHKEAASE